MLIEGTESSRVLSNLMLEANACCEWTSDPLRRLPLRTRSTPHLTVVLDLDETLVHSETVPIENPDCVVPLSGNRWAYVKFRPGLFEFLEKSSGLFELVVFTASEQSYADSILNAIDPTRRYIKHRFYRDSCCMVSGGYVKDLRVLGRDLNNTVIVDNCFLAFAFNIRNGIPILSWFNDDMDRELDALINLLMIVKDLQDVRPCLHRMFKLEQIMLNIK